MFCKQCRQNVLRHLCYNKSSNQLEVEPHLLEMDHKDRMSINWLHTVCRPWAGQLAQWHGKWLQSCPILCDLMDCSPQAPLPMGFSRQEYWSELSHPPPGDLPDPGIKPVSLTSPALAGWFFTTCATWEAPSMNGSQLIYSFYSLWAISSFDVGDNYKLVLLWMLQYKSFCKHTCTFCWVSA